MLRSRRDYAVTGVGSRRPSAPSESQCSSEGAERCRTSRRVRISVRRSLKEPTHLLTDPNAAPERPLGPHTACLSGKLELARGVAQSRSAVRALCWSVVRLPLCPALTGSDRNRRVGPAGGVTRRFRRCARRSTRSRALSVGNTMHVGYRWGGTHGRQHKGQHQYSLDKSSHRSGSFRIEHSRL